MKKRCVEEVEVKNNKSNEQTLLNMHAIDQIVAESITNAFAQVNMNKPLSGWLIPTFRCTSEHVNVFLYDPVNDILLQSIELLQLWETEGALDIQSVVRV